jgi:lipopolysaccharide export system permease protein
MKSAGVSLLRIMKPAIYLSIFTALLSIFSSNYLKPVAAFKYQKKFNLMRKQNTLLIEEGIFNQDFNNFSIRVAKKNKNNRDMKDVLMYDHSSPDKALIHMIKADSAEMFSSDDGRYFVMDLHNGNQYQEQERGTSAETGRIQYPMVRTDFKKWHKVFDMSSFFIGESDILISKSREDFLNSFQLLAQIDTLNQSIKKFSSKSEALYAEMENQKSLSDTEYTTEINRQNLSSLPTIPDIPKSSQEKIPSVKKTIDNKDGSINPENVNKIIKNKEKFARKQKLKKTSKKTQPIVANKSRAVVNEATIFKRIKNYDLNKVPSFTSTFDSITIKNLILRANPYMSKNADLASSALNNVEHSMYQKEVYTYRLNQQYSFAIVCIVFLFIGAPLGSIIRKGGYGYPLLVAIIFYMIFIIVNILGEKLLKSEVLNGLIAAWLPTLVLLPFALYFTYQALRDIRFSWFEKIKNYINFIFLRTKKE